MRNHPQLTSESGIVRTDTDHTILRYKTHDQGRRFQLMIDVEVKEFGSIPDEAQRDILAMKHQLTFNKGKNRHNARTVITRKVKSIKSRGMVNVRYLGFHLLQFEKTNPQDSQWIKWNYLEISEWKLVGLLALEFDPYNPARTMNELLRDRHAARIARSLPLFESDEAA